MAQTPNYRVSSLLYSYKRIRITEVNTKTGYVEGIDSSRQSIKISFKWFYHPFLAIPEIGEDWLVFKMDNNWVLHSRYESGEESIQVSDLEPGDRRVEAPTGTIYFNAQKIVFNETSLESQFDGSAFKLPLKINAGTENIDYTLFELGRSGESWSKVSFADKKNEDAVRISWGSGSADHDVSLYRSGTSTLTLEGNLIIDGTLTHSVDSNSDYFVYNYNDRRTFNPASTTVQEVGEVLATLLVDLGYAPSGYSGTLSGAASLPSSGGTVPTSGGGTGGTGTAGTGTAGTVTPPPTGGSGTAPTGGGGTASTGPQTVTTISFGPYEAFNSPTITGTTPPPNPGGGGTTPPTTNYTANVRPWDPAHIIYMPIPTTVVPHQDSTSIINTLNNGNSRLSNFKGMNWDTGGDTAAIYVGTSSDPTWTINGSFSVKAPNGLTPGSGSDHPLIILDQSSASYGGLPVEYRMWQASVNSGAKTISCNGLGIGCYANDGTIVPAAYRQDSSPGHRGPATGHAEIYGQNTGSGESYSVGMIRPIDVQRGYIDHAIRVAVGFPRNQTMGSISYMWPATRSEGGSNSSYCMTTTAGIPMGSRLTFQRSVNWQTVGDQAASRLSNSLNQAFARMFVRAIYEYGLIMLDGTSGTFNVYFEGETADWVSLIGPKNSSGSYNDIARAVVAVIPWSQMMVPDLSNWSGYVS